MTTAQLGEYFAGDRQYFELPVAQAGGEFQHRVWGVVSRIPYGQTRMYGHIARELGQPVLAQAVGCRNCTHPLCVILPRHRVVGADGSLVGYAGGLGRKRFLLDLETSDQELSARLF